MDPSQDVSAERRARLAAEQMLAQTRAELSTANQRLASHARSLSNEVVQSRETIATAQSEVETFRDRYTNAQADLARAESAITIAEQRLWDSLETIRDGFAVFDRNNVLIAANRAYLSVFDGLDMVQPGIPMELVLELMADEGICDIGEHSSAGWQAMMLDRIAQDRIDHIILRLWNGQYVQLIDRRTRSGDLVSLALNITEQQNREKQLRDARERAEAANRAKSAFLANMSHEIRTPMNGVVGMIDMLSETNLDGEQRAYIDTIRSSGEALLVIINDVLDYSKIEAEKISFKSAPFDLERCINDVVMLLQPSAEAKGLQVVVDYDLFMPTTYVGDAGRIRQVLTNLVGNAVKFTGEGHVLIRVVGLPGEGGAAYRVHVTVEDTGIGIPKDKLEVVFKEFQQVENERDRTHDGTGLGLAITQRLVRLMGGDVWVDSTEGVGSGFGFSVTLDALEEVEQEHITAPPWLDRALILDDEGMHRSILTKQLGLIGLRPISVETMDDIAAERPTEKDVIFLGALPDQEDAFQAAAALRDQFSVGGLFHLISGPTKVPDSGSAFDRHIQRPVLRADMMASLLSLDEPMETVVTPEAPTLVPEPVADDVTGSADPSEAPSSDVRAMRVLVAEDNRTNRFVVEKMLSALDIELVFAENGIEAVELYQSCQPDILFTDISMPRLDGKAATRQIRAYEQEHTLTPCPIVAITAHAMDGDADDILAAGVDHYLTKPLKKQALVEHIVSAQPPDARPALPLADAPEDTAPNSLTGTAAE